MNVNLLMPIKLIQFKEKSVKIKGWVFGKLVKGLVLKSQFWLALLQNVQLILTLKKDKIELRCLYLDIILLHNCTISSFYKAWIKTCTDPEVCLRKKIQTKVISVTALEKKISSPLSHFTVKIYSVDGQ
jgi:hypothetical protein